MSAQAGMRCPTAISHSFTSLFFSWQRAELCLVFQGLKPMEQPFCAQMGVVVVCLC
jgi:hypothetical protein